MDRKRNLIVGGGAVAALAGLYLLVADDRSGDAPALAQRAAAAPAQKRAKEIADMTTPPALPAESGRSSDCLIEPSRVVRVNSGVEGVVEAIYVDRGDAVGKGQLVARLKADVDRASAAAAQARATNVHAVRAAEARARSEEHTSELQSL